MSDIVKVKLGYRTPLYGVGINDADYVVQIRETLSGTGNKRKRKTVWVCPFYYRWAAMLTRCYSKTSARRRPKYVESYVCDEWLLFSNFKAWMEQQDWADKQLDKDLLVADNKVYSPETCLFVTPDVNVFMTENKETKGDLPVGVHLHTVNGNYIAQISTNGKRRHLGCYDTPEEAHQVWKAAKKEQAIYLASIQNCPITAAALIERYN